MFKRNWVIAVAFGLILAVSLQAQNQEDGAGQQPANEQEQPQTDIFGFPVQLVESQETAATRERSEAESRQREIDDLVAQQGMNAATQSMNKATQSMKNAAWVSAGLVFLGTGLLVWTLSITREANGAALKAVEVTENIGRDGARAYLDVDFAFIERQRSGNIAVINITNSGKTPAKWITVLAESRVFQADDGQPEWAVDRSIKGSDWSGVSGGGACCVPAYSEGEAEKIGAVINAKGKSTLLVFGLIRYETIYSEIFETTFSFHTNDPRPRAHVRGAQSFDTKHNLSPLYASPEIVSKFRLVLATTENQRTGKH